MKIPKTVKSQTIKLNKEEEKIIQEIMDSTLPVKQMFQERFSGIGSMNLSFRDMRDIIRAEQKTAYHGKTISEVWNIPERFWVRVLKDTSMEINSMWSNLRNRCCKVIQDYKHLPDNIRHYCYYVFYAKPIWHKILFHEDVSSIKTKKFKKLWKALSPEELSFTHSMIRRVTRKYKPKKLCSKELHCISFDVPMYDIRNEESHSVLSIMTCHKGKRLVLPLTSLWTYKKGDVQIIWDEKDKVIRIHKLIQAKCRKSLPKEEKVGIDKGLVTLLSCSSGNEYGEGFNEGLKEEANRLNERNTHRNYFIQQKKELRLSRKTLKIQKRRKRNSII